MFKLFLQLIVLMLIICALGCNKGRQTASAGGDAAKAPKVEDIKPGDAGAENIDLAAATDSTLPTTAESQMVHDELVAAFEKDGYTFDSGSDSIMGGKLPKQGVKVSSIVPLVVSTAIDLGGVNDPAIRAKAIVDFKARFISLVEAQAATPGGAEGVTKGFEQAGETAAGVDPSMALAKESLRFSDDPVGEWKSTKEVLDADAEVRVEHNDKYYKLLQVFYEGTCRYQEYRDGNIVSDGTYPWGYDPATGKLLLRASDGSVFDELLVMNRPSEAKMIYVKGSQDYQYTVYEKVGSGNKPRTEADLKKEAEEFEKAKERLVGGEGGEGTAAGGGSGNSGGSKDEGRGKGK